MASPAARRRCAPARPDMDRALPGIPGRRRPAALRDGWRGRRFDARGGRISRRCRRPFGRAGGRSSISPSTCCAGPGGSPPLPQSERKARLRRLLRGRRPTSSVVEDFGAPGEAVLRSAAGRHGRRRLQARDAPMWRAQRQLGEEQMPRGGGVVIGGWSLDRHGRGFARCWPGRGGMAGWSISALGTGFGAARSRELLTGSPRWNARQPFAGRQPARLSDVHWARPNWWADRLRRLDGDGLLRQASFTALREDKPATEVTMPTRPRRRTAPRRPATRRPATRGGALTHPERELWPARRPAGSDQGDARRLLCAPRAAAAGASARAAVSIQRTRRHRRRALLPAPRHARPVAAAEAGAHPARPGPI